MGRKVSIRIVGLVLAVVGAVAVVGNGGGSSPPDFGQPFAGLTASELQRFSDGQDEFKQVETMEEGLGPVFNDMSCANCHSSPAVGGGSTRLETRFGARLSNGTFDPLSQFGGSLIQEQGIGVAGACEYLAETVPPQATIVAGRRTTPLFGLGLVDGIPDALLRYIAYQQKSDPDNIAGKVSIVTNVETGLPDVGKFGWKAQNATLHVFAADAYVNEMGVTSPMFPSENCPQGDCASLSCNPDPGVNDDGSGVQAFTDFMRFLAPPPRGPISGSVLAGEYEFNKLGCASCHVSTMRTGPSSTAALNQVTFHPYSDFLLHDMGRLGDGITQNQATGRLMRTAPLWGVRKIETLLHDGRAKTLTEAILAHDGQARTARDRFARLSSFDRARVIAFLNSL
ncbi:MAG TPA: di-heme oxidoredictase family protein [Thermoanaerobaculia bacterium]|nr:di-heme oxidoredictase family protein [Thermoanaerobaculia bacterium]